MAKHLERELDKLKRDLLGIGALVESAVQKSIVAFQQRNGNLAQQVIKEDSGIDEREVDVEEDCLKILALHQPVAEDLRFIAAVMKINNDLERIGDCAVHLARRTNSLVKEPEVNVPVDLSRMSKLAAKMVHDALDAFIRRDVQLARQICRQDDEVDECNRTIIREIRQMMHDRPEQIDQGLDIFTSTRRLERIADLATNIAQDVIYLVEGKIVRHSADL